MIDHWGWVHVQGATVQFSARTYPTPEEARDGLQAHLDAHVGEAAQRLRDLPAHVSSEASVHLPGHSWRVHASDREVRVFVGDDCRSYRRPAASPAPAPTPDLARKRRVSIATDSPYLMRFQVVGGLLALGGIATAVSGDFEGNRVAMLLFVPLGLALLLCPALLNLLRKRRQGE